MPTAPGYAQIAIQMTHANNPRPAYITFGVQPTSTDPQVICGQVQTALVGSGGFQSSMDSEVQFTEIRCSLGTDGSEDLVGAIASTLAGLNALTSPPSNCAVLVHKRTARGGRRGRGRMYIPWFVNESSIDEAGLITSSTVTILQSIMNDFLAKLTAQNVPMVVLHDPGKTVQGAPNAVVALTPDKIIGTQRRRLGR